MRLLRWICGPKAEGMETLLTVNIVGMMLLVILLLPKLKDTAKKYAI
jgi:hypothetical protein